MRFPPSILEEIRVGVSLSRLVGKRVKLVRRGGDFFGLCPFHKEKTPSFKVSDEKGFYHCFGCQAHGSVFDFLMNAEGLTFPEAVERLAIEAGIELPTESAISETTVNRSRRLFQVMSEASDWYQEQLLSDIGRNAKKYLLERGLNDPITKKFGIGYAPNSRAGLRDALLSRGITQEEMLVTGLLVNPNSNEQAYDRFRNRVMFPIRNSRGNTIAFGGRALGNAKAKYLNSPETDLFIKGRTLYGVFEARKAIYEAKGVLVAEGYMDVISLAKVGFDNTVASLGTALTEDQIGLLWRLAPEPVLCLDGDVAGRRAALSVAQRALPLLKPGFTLRFAMLPEGEDPDSLARNFGFAEIKAIINQSVTLSELLWLKERNMHRLDSPEREAGFRSRLEEVTEKIRDSSVREAYQNAFRQRFENEFRTGRGSLDRPSGFSSPKIRRVAKSSGAGNRISSKLRHSALARGDDQVARERFIIAAVLNHPEMLSRGEEAFASIRLGDQNLDNLRSGILKAASVGNLDSQILRSHLDSGGLGEVAARLMEEVTKSYPRLLDSKASVEIEKAWQNALALHRRSFLQKEIGAAWVEFATDSSESAKGRVTLLQEELGGVQGVRTRGNLING